MRRALLISLLALLAAVAVSPAARAAEQSVRVASKTFTESVILAEIVRLLVESEGLECDHQAELGGTRVLWNALVAGEIDAYAEYSGTLTQEILAGRNLSTLDGIRTALAEFEIELTAPLGFNNTYALGMRKPRAAELSVDTISDLREHPQLRFGFSNEFMNRGDGWPALRARYALPQTDVQGLNHDIAYRALQNGDVDLIDLYATDAEIPYYDLHVLDDDLRHFPAYEAVILYRRDLAQRAPRAVAAMQRLAGRIDDAQMQALNARAKLDGVPESVVAADFLSNSFGLNAEVTARTLAQRLTRRTIEHLRLVAVSMAAAIFVAIPLGIWSARQRSVGQGILGAVGIIQTIPALALLVILMKPMSLLGEAWPLLGQLGVRGIGEAPAIAALFLYSLLPIVRNTHAGLTEIPASVLESATALGLPPAARLWRVELPIASRTILAGIKISAVINVGFATLGALIGAGGYGQPILTGIRLDNYALILEGALPAAALAIAVQGLFELAERVFVPRGLRLRPTR